MLGQGTWDAPVGRPSSDRKVPTGSAGARPRGGPSPTGPRTLGGALPKPASGLQAAKGGRAWRPRSTEAQSPEAQSPGYPSGAPRHAGVARGTAQRASTACTAVHYIFSEQSCKPRYNVKPAVPTWPKRVGACGDPWLHVVKGPHLPQRAYLSGKSIPASKASLPSVDSARGVVSASGASMRTQRLSR